MNENDKSRSGLQTAVDFAHAARAAKRIMQAAAVSGVHGAAAATAREAFPLLLKVLVAALVVFIVMPTLAVALLSTECFERECCHITLLPLEDAHDFFAAHSSDYASQDFYSGQWC